MTHEVYELNCANCKTNLTIKTIVHDECLDFKLVYCPNCRTPIREVRSNDDYFVERVCLVNCK